MTTIYVNGDSHTAAAEAVNPHAFAEDDGQLFYMGRAPHPDNLKVSWGYQLAELAKTKFHCGAESASSNDRIMRTTKDWLNHKRTNDVLVIIQWSTWEREEWLHNDIYYQVNASGIDHVPDTLKLRYKEFIANVDWNLKTREWHDKIWSFHQELESQKIKHFFFNGNTHFGKIANKHDWNNSYLEPYNQLQTFDKILNQKFSTVTPDSYHYGPEAHSYWARFMLKTLSSNNLL